jgi:hypothetical protein
MTNTQQYESSLPTSWESDSSTRFFSLFSRGEVEANVPFQISWHRRICNCGPVIPIISKNHVFAHRRVLGSEHGRLDESPGPRPIEGLLFNSDGPTRSSLSLSYLSFIGFARVQHASLAYPDAGTQ